MVASGERLCVLRFGLVESRDVGVGILPEGEEILIRGPGPGLSESMWAYPAFSSRVTERSRFCTISAVMSNSLIF